MKIDVNALKGVVSIVQEAAEVVPVLLSAYHALFGIWKAQNPQGTFDQFDAALKAASDEEVNFTAAWLISHGYVQDAAGDWSKPAPPQVPPPPVG